MDRRIFRKKLMTLVLPIAFQQFMLAVVSASDALMVGTIEQDLLSAVSLASQLTFVYNLFLAALTIGTSMFAAQYWGKGDCVSIEKILGMAVKAAVFVTALFTAAALAVPDMLMSIFTSDPAVINYGHIMLTLLVPGYFLLAISHAISGVLRGANRAATAMIIVISCWCGLRMAWILTSVPIFHSIHVVLLGWPISWLVSTIIFILYYRRLRKGRLRCNRSANAKAAGRAGNRPGKGPCI